MFPIFIDLDNNQVFWNGIFSQTWGV